MLGILRDSWRLTALATAGLVVFTTFQSFAVFAQIIQGAWLFVVLGLVFLGTGYGFDRARRELAATLEGAGPMIKRIALVARSSSWRWCRSPSCRSSPPA